MMVNSYPSAHPSVDVLADYASGALSDGMSLLVAGHLTYCAACRQRVAAFEAVAGACLVDMAEEMAVAAPVIGPDLMARLDRADLREPEVPEQADYLPFPIGRALRQAGREIRWRFLVPGLQECVVAGYGAERVSLLRARPGVRILDHTHDGAEATLVLTGSMKDGRMVYGPGDVAFADHTDHHHPEIVGDGTCHCLVVLSGSMRFSGTVGRALNFLTG